MASPTLPNIPDPTRPRRKNTLKRADLAPGDCLCNHCSGKCCKYFTLPIDGPTSWDDYDEVGRYLDHGLTLVYVEKGTWYLVVMTRCGYLMQDNRCRVYLDRPKICRDYTTTECEYDEDWVFDKVFESAAQLLEYAEAVLPPRRRPKPSEPTDTRSFTLPIDPPTCWDDYDAIRWYLAHGSTLIFLRKARWYLQVMAGSERLDPANPLDKVFEAPEQIWEYAEAILPPRKRPPSSLTVISLAD